MTAAIQYLSVMPTQPPVDEKVLGGVPGSLKSLYLASTLAAIGDADKAQMQHPAGLFLGHALARHIGEGIKRLRSGRICWSTLSATVNMYWSSSEMTRVKTRPWPLSQVRVTGWPGESVPPFAAVHTRLIRGMSAAPTQPNSA